MSNKSSKSPTGEDREQKNPHQRKTEEQGKQAQAETPKSSGGQKGPKQENLSNRGYEEDQPRNPVRSTGSMNNNQESLPTGEPEAGDY